jgi:hypothetical protein
MTRNLEDPPAGLKFCENFFSKTEVDAYHTKTGFKP